MSQPPNRAYEQPLWITFNTTSDIRWAGRDWRCRTFSLVFYRLVSGCFYWCKQNSSTLEGWNGQKSIAYNPTICSCDLIETFGKIVAHSIVQTGLGLSCLAYAIYYYICTGKIESAVPYLTIAEVPCHKTKEYLTQVQAIYFSFHNFNEKYSKKIYLKPWKKFWKLCRFSPYYCLSFPV